MTTAKKTDSLESLLKKLETLVQKLEGDNLSLEESLKLYEQGVGITKKCQAKLGEAEKKIKMLSDDDTLVDFDEEV